PEIEARLAESPEARQYVEDIRATAQLLTEQLRKEPGPGLHPKHHQAIEGQLNATPKKRRYRWVPYAVAASCLAVCGLLTVATRMLVTEDNEKLVMAEGPTETVAAPGVTNDEGEMYRKGMLEQQKKRMPSGYPGLRRNRKDGGGGGGGGYGASATALPKS